MYQLLITVRRPASDGGFGLQTRIAKFETEEAAEIAAEQVLAANFGQESSGYWRTTHEVVHLYRRSQT